MSGFLSGFFGVASGDGGGGGGDGGGSGGGGGGASAPAAASLEGRWVKKGDEGCSITVPAGSTLKFGFGLNWVRRTCGGRVEATSAFFGRDPLPGARKELHQWAPAAVDRALLFALPGDDPLGEGGNSGIHLAWYHGRECVIKECLPHCIGEAPDMLRKEAALMRRMEHPGVLPLLHAFDGEERPPQLVLPVAEGGSVGAIVKQLRGGGGGGGGGGAPPAPWAKRVLVEAAEAVAYMHAEGLVHGDIKPDNLLVKRAGGVWLCDFNVSRDAGAEVGGFGDVLGTPPYVAPENFLSDAPTAQQKAQYGRPPCDVFALAVLAVALAAGGAAAVEGADIGGMVKGTWDPRKMVPAAMDGELAALVRECLASDPATRPSAAAFAARVRALDWGGDAWAAAAAPCCEGFAAKLELQRAMGRSRRFHERPRRWVCGAAHAPGEAPCRHVNPPSAPGRCEACLAVFSEFVEKPGWACGECTLENPGWRLSCEVCGLEKGYVQPAPPPRVQLLPPQAPQSWECPVCTLSNAGGVNCAICGHEKPPAAAAAAAAAPARAAAAAAAAAADDVVLEPPTPAPPPPSPPILVGHLRALLGDVAVSGAPSTALWVDGVQDFQTSILLNMQLTNNKCPPSSIAPLKPIPGSAKHMGYTVLTFPTEEAARAAAACLRSTLGLPSGFCAPGTPPAPPLGLLLGSLRAARAADAEGAAALCSALAHVLLSTRVPLEGALSPSAVGAAVLAAVKACPGGGDARVLRGAAFALAALQAGGAPDKFPVAVGPLARAFAAAGDRDRGLALAAAVVIQRGGAPNAAREALPAMHRALAAHGEDPLVCEALAGVIEASAWETSGVAEAFGGRLLAQLCELLRRFGGGGRGPLAAAAAAALCSALAALLRLPGAAREEAAALGVAELARGVFAAHPESARACKAAAYLVSVAGRGMSEESARALLELLQAAAERHEGRMGKAVDAAMRVVYQVVRAAW